MSSRATASIFDRRVVHLLLRYSHKASEVEENMLMGANRDPERWSYMVERSPWTRTKDLKDVLISRGAIVAAWGYTETLLTDILIRSSYMDEYCRIRAQYPFVLDKRLSYARQVLASVGPFSKYHAVGSKILDHFQKARRLRDQMAHSHMHVLEGTATFTDYRPISGEIIRRFSEQYTLRALQEMARKATQLSRLFQKAHYILDRESWLPSRRTTD